MTRKEAAIILKQYEKNRVVSKVTDEYLNAKKIWKQHVEKLDRNGGEDEVRDRNDSE